MIETSELAILQRKEKSMEERAAMERLDALEQRAAENSVRRLRDLMDAIGISATAAVMGPGAVASIADCLKYSKNTVKKLAAMHDLPEDCIDLNLKPGTYWAILLYAEEAGVAPVEFIRSCAIPEQMSPAEAKRAMGIEVVRESALDKLKERLEELERKLETRPSALALADAAERDCSFEAAEWLREYHWHCSLTRVSPKEFAKEYHNDPRV